MMSRTSCAWLPTTTMMRWQPAAIAASATHSIIGLPRILWATLAWLDFMRVPSPAARMMAVASMNSPELRVPYNAEALGLRRFTRLRAGRCTKNVTQIEQDVTWMIP